MSTLLRVKSVRAPQARRLDPAPEAHWEPQAHQITVTESGSSGGPVEFEQKPGLTGLHVSVSYDL